jgi:hypothetical protein
MTFAECKVIIYEEIKRSYDTFKVVSLLTPSRLKLFLYQTQIEITGVPPGTDALSLLVAGLDEEGLIVCPHFINRCCEMRFKDVYALHHHNREASE